VEGFFCNGKRAKNLLDPVSLPLTPCFPLSMKWRGGLKGERVKGFILLEIIFYPPMGRRTKFMKWQIYILPKRNIIWKVSIEKISNLGVFKL